MTNATCLWPDCETRMLHGCGLCKRHWQRAHREGVLESFRAAMIANLPPCKQCGGTMAGRTRPRSQFCGKPCYNKWYAANGVARATPEKQRGYSKRYNERLRAERIAAAGERRCIECGEVFSSASRSRRRFCSRFCINQRRLRERPDQAREAHQRYRARKRANDVRVVTETDWRRLVDRYSRRCAYCATAGPLTQDHIIPISRGGRHAIGNLLPACTSCNSRKRDRLLAHVRYQSRTLTLAA